jgi:phosphonate ABC transporter permease subunit PhnE
LTIVSNSEERQSTLHTILSLIIPGLGQMVAGAFQRGLAFLLSVVVLSYLSIWTIAQKARFPEEYIGAGTRVFFLLVLETFALLIFLLALRYLMARFVLRDAASQAFSIAGFAVLYAIVVVLLTNPLLNTIADAETLNRLHTQTAVISAAAMAAFWLWQALDAGRLGGGQKARSMTPGILITLLLIFVLGWSITQIDLGKAISEYRDTQKILGNIFWPWRSAFEFEITSNEASQKIQAPCPPGATGPPVNEVLADGTWISATPTCGELTVRDLTGGIEFGTEMVITGGGYEPGQIVEIWWKNPIGNPFQPRSVGETSILIDENGEFTSNLIYPSAVVPDTAVGDQIHTLIARQESEQVFTGNLSREMILALTTMLETIMLALMATFFGIIVAFPLSFLAARNLMAPISSPLRTIIGGLFLLLPALWLAGQATSLVAASLGGLEIAPIPIASIGLILVLLFGFIGYSVGGRALSALNRNVAESRTSFITALLAAPLGAIVGWVVGLGVANGIVSIPLGAEVVDATTVSTPFPIISSFAGGISFSSNPSLAVTIAFSTALLFALLSFSLALRHRAEGDIKIGMVIYSIARTTLNIIRSIEPLIWAIVATIWVGLGPFAGTIALTLHTIAALAKLYSESIESIETGPIEAIQATGATRLQTIIYAVVPQILPPFISFTIYRWDINVRLSTIIGLVGGGGIGFLLIQWIRQYQYNNAGLAVWLIAVTVASLDYISSRIRERFV